MSVFGQRFFVYGNFTKEDENFILESVHFQIMYPFITVHDELEPVWRNYVNN